MDEHFLEYVKLSARGKPRNGHRGLRKNPRGEDQWQQVAALDTFWVQSRYRGFPNQFIV